MRRQRVPLRIPGHEATVSDPGLQGHPRGIERMEHDGVIALHDRHQIAGDPQARLEQAIANGPLVHDDVMPHPMPVVPVVHAERPVVHLQPITVYSL